MTEERTSTYSEEDLAAAEAEAAAEPDDPGPDVEDTEADEPLPEEETE
jgi:hypothetical protein